VIFFGLDKGQACIRFIFSLKTFFMKQVHIAAKIFSLFLILFFCQSFSGPSGGEYYKVLLNNKLITEQFLTKPVSMKTLSLTASNNNDHLTVYYSHCGNVGKDRSVSVRNQSGAVLKEWRFADSKAMELQVPVKEILSTPSKNSSLFLYYASKEVPSGKQLLAIDLSNKATAKL
jgi:hypothetical protein